MSSIRAWTCCPSSLPGQGPALPGRARASKQAGCRDGGIDVRARLARLPGRFQPGGEQARQEAQALADAIGQFGGAAAELDGGVGDQAPEGPIVGASGSRVTFIGDPMAAVVQGVEEVFEPRRELSPLNPQRCCCRPSTARSRSTCSKFARLRSTSRAMIRATGCMRRLMPGPTTPPRTINSTGLNCGAPLSAPPKFLPRPSSLESNGGSKKASELAFYGWTLWGLTRTARTLQKRWSAR
jgi:hypothetical protein